MTDIRLRSREEIIASLSSGSPNEIRDALISACYWDKDWKWALQELRKFAEHGDDLVLWAVATGVGFIAAFNGEIDEHEAQSILARLKANANSAVAAAAEEAEADIEYFVGHRERGEDVELVERLPKDWLLLPNPTVTFGIPSADANAPCLQTR
jgi:HEAT repeat protein